MAGTVRDRAQGLFVPLALAGTLLTGFINLVGLAYWAGGLNARTSRNETDVKEALSVAKEAARALSASERANFQQAVEQAADLKRLMEDQQKQQQEFRLFQDQTWGRIYDMPYKTPPRLP